MSTHNAVLNMDSNQHAERFSLEFEQTSDKLDQILYTVLSEAAPLSSAEFVIALSIK